MPVRLTTELAFPIGQVWAMISNFGGIARWHPMLMACEAEGQGVGSSRRLQFADWWATEELTLLDPVSHSIAYHVTASSRPEYVGMEASLMLATVDSGCTRLDWISGLPDDHKEAGRVNSMLEAYYPVRVGHLTEALKSGQH